MAGARATAGCRVGENRPVTAPIQGAVVRFDDTRPGGTAVSLTNPRAVLVAHDVHDVLGVLEAADAAASSGSWVAGYVGYEAASAFDPALATGRHRGGDEVPPAWFAVFDDLEEAAPLGRVPDARARYRLGPWRADCDVDAYRAKVGRVREHISDGDTYQVNLTARLRSRFDGDPFALYRDLALAQASEYCAYLDTGRFVVASASPELFFEWRGDRITARPMKGTGPRGRWVQEDEAFADRLATSEKDRAENVMIVDLVRNDIGRIARWGSVRVDELFSAERYETLWQLTSTVSAAPRPGTRLADVFGALFPSGSVTGAPKRRTMELIAALEDAPRGVYCGAIGLLAPPGSPWRARFSVAIRTAVVDRESEARRLRRGRRDHLGLGPRRRARRTVVQDGDPGGTEGGLRADRDDGLLARDGHPQPVRASRPPGRFGRLLRLPLRHRRGARGARPGDGGRGALPAPPPPRPRRRAERRTFDPPRARRRAGAPRRRSRAGRLFLGLAVPQDHAGAAPTRPGRPATPRPTTSSS